MIVQEHFPPAPTTAGLESGPLFGVQFSQLPCSDLAARFGAGGAAALIGPKRSPLGLSADPGGLPLRSEEHTSELQSLMRSSYAVFCLKQKTNTIQKNRNPNNHTHGHTTHINTHTKLQ